MMTSHSIIEIKNLKNKQVVPRRENMSVWNEIKLVIKEEDIEFVEGILYTLDVKGISIEDPKDITGREQGPLTWDFADLNIFEYDKHHAVMKAYFNVDEDIEEIIEEIKEKIAKARENGLSISEVIITSTEVHEEDWANEWKKYYKPLHIGSRFVIKPLWEDYVAKEGEIILHMDPGMAFGTGTHETTRMCLEAIDEYSSENHRVFDIGTGSGILAIAAAKLGAKEVIGVDLDMVAVASAKENVEHNQLKNVQILKGNLLDVVEGKADLVVANIIAEVIKHITSDVKKALKDNGIFIASGIIKEKEEFVKEELLLHGFVIKEVKREGEWVCIISEAHHA